MSGKGIKSICQSPDIFLIFFKEWLMQNKLNKKVKESVKENLLHENFRCSIVEKTFRN